MPIRSFFELLKQATKLNIVVGDEVKGDISLKVRGVSWIEVFEMVLKEKNLISDVTKSGNFVTIHWCGSLKFYAPVDLWCNKHRSSRMKVRKSPK